MLRLNTRRISLSLCFNDSLFSLVSFHISFSLSHWIFIELTKQTSFPEKKNQMSRNLSQKKKNKRQFVSAFLSEKIKRSLSDFSLFQLKYLKYKSSLNLHKNDTIFKAKFTIFFSILGYDWSQGWSITLW